MPDFNVALVGSSPLLLLEAIRRARNGSSVCIFDASDSFGGSWSFVETIDGLLIEQACHLIEPFPDIYDILEEYSGLPFEPLSPQPIRQFNFFFNLPYSNRLIVLFAGLRVLFIFVILCLRYPFSGCSLSDKHHNYYVKAKYFLQTQLSQIFSFRAFLCKAPRGGYANFVNQLIINASNLGVVFSTSQVTHATFDPLGNQWLLTTDLPYPVTCSFLGVSSSTNLRYTSSSSLVALTSTKRVRNSALVSVSSSYIDQPHSYISPFSDEIIQRISRLDFPSSGSSIYYLVELKGLFEHDFLLSYINSFFHSASIQTDPNAVELLQLSSFSYYSGVSQLSLSHNLPSFSVYQSFGNLACGILQWKKQQ